MLRSARALSPMLRSAPALQLPIVRSARHGERHLGERVSELAVLQCNEHESFNEDRAELGKCLSSDSALSRSGEREIQSE